MLTRVKTVFKSREPARDSKRLSAAPAKAGPSTTTAAPSTSRAAAETKKDDQAPAPTKIPRFQIYEERAKKLGERYGLEIKPSEWYSTEGHALRVEKPIRVRVHRECHKCGHTFGVAKECPSCQHVRCKECQRRPPKRTEAEREASRRNRAALLKERAENPPIIPDWNPIEKKVVLTRPAKRGGQDLVHKKPRQRVRRNCCQCETLFITHNKTCPGCQHVRCTDCPRDPPKKDKYPYGYPGDEFGAKSIPRYECKECKTVFPADATAETECSKCSHKMGDNSARAKPRRVEPEPDPEVWKSLQAKLGNLSLK